MMPNREDIPGKPTHAGIEFGGTKTVVAATDSSGRVTGRASLPTTDARTTVDAALARLLEIFAGRPPETLGLAAFGPVQVRMNAPDFGKMLATPKPGWAGFDLMKTVEGALPGTRVALDTDVNAAALAEGRFGAARGCRDWAYITIGTGIGAGFVSGGRVVCGTNHPEFGHWKPPRHPDDAYAGACPFHSDCLEGMAAGPAVGGRWGCDARELPADHPAWEIQAHYLAHACLNILSVFAPERILFGGGVSQVPGLLDLVEEKTRGLANGYFPVLTNERGKVIRPAYLGQDAGTAGGVLLGYPTLPAWISDQA